jgi:hypothetical protein
MFYSNEHYQTALRAVLDKIESGEPLQTRTTNLYGGLTNVSCSWGLCGLDSPLHKNIIVTHPTQRCPLDIRPPIVVENQFPMMELKSCYYYCKVFTGPDVHGIPASSVVTKENAIMWYNQQLIKK